MSPYPFGASQAVGMYNEALRYNPRDVRALRNIEVAFQQQGDYEAAAALRHQVATVEAGIGADYVDGSPHVGRFAVVILGLPDNNKCVALPPPRSLQRAWAQPEVLPECATVCCRCGGTAPVQCSMTSPRRSIVAYWSSGMTVSGRTARLCSLAALPHSASSTARYVTAGPTRCCSVACARTSPAVCVGHRDWIAYATSISVPAERAPNSYTACRDKPEPRGIRC
jgi:hypothetical protein